MMTKEDKLDIVDRLKFDAARCEVQFSKGVASNITKAIAEIERLRAAARPSPDAGLVDREAIAEDLQRWVKVYRARPAYDRHDPNDLLPYVMERAAVFLLSAQRVAGEPVACWRIHNKRGWKSQWQDGAPPSPDECDPITIERAYLATPAPEGRDPATIEALKLAIGHIEHMAAWITAQKSGYSFESLGEDMPKIRALAIPADRQQDKAETSVLP